MSFWDELGKTAAQQVPGIGQGILSAIDVVRAIGSKEDKPIKQQILDNYGVTKDVQAGAAQVVGAPGISQALHALALGYSYGVARPISTWDQTIGQTGMPHQRELGGGTKGVFGSAAWKQAWENSKDTSPGQVTIANSGLADGALKGLDFSAIHKAGERGDAKFDTKFSLASGAVDGLISWYADPLVVAGKAAKAARLAKTEIRAGDTAALTEPAESLTRRQAKIKSQSESFIQDTDGYSASELARFKSFKNNVALASVFAKASGDHELKRLVLRSAWGDTAAVGELAAKRADIAGQLNRMTSNLDDVVYADELAPEGSLFAHYNDQHDISTIVAEKKANTEMLDLYDRILPDFEAAKQADAAGTHLDQQSLGVFGANPVRPKVTQKDLNRLAKDKAYVIQDGVGDLPMRVLHTSTNRRPEGLIDLHDAEQGFTAMDNMLKRVRGLDPAFRQERLDNFVNAQDDNARMLTIQHTEQAVFKHIGESLGYTPEETQSLLNKVLVERGKALSSVQNRAFTAATGADGETPVDALRLEDGTLIHRPLLETHLANSVPTLDVDHVYRVFKRNKDTVGALRGDSAWDVTKDGLGLFNDLWKFSSLLRLGYMQRNVIDGQIRLFGVLGGIDHVRTMAENVGQGVAHKLDKFKAKQAWDTANHHLAQVKKELAETPKDAEHYDDLVDLKESLETTVSTGIDYEGLKPHFGQGHVQNGPYKSEDAFGSTLGDYERNRELVSGEDMWANFAAGEAERRVNKLRGSGDWVTKKGDAPGHTDAWLRVVNDQFRNSQIAMKLLKGETPHEVATWLKSPEGRALRRRMVHRWDSPEELVQAASQNINHVIPDEGFRALAAERKLTAEDLKSMAPMEHTRPAVNAEQIAYSMGQGAFAQSYNKVRDGYFKWMNTMPDNVMGRHPVYRQMYRGKLRQLLANADPSAEGVLSRAEQRVLEEQSRVFARREMKRVMFDVSSQSNMAHWLRFVSPFVAAWEDSMTKYGRIILNDPSVLPHLWQAWTAPNDSSLFEVVNADGTPVKGKDSNITDGEFIRLPTKLLDGLGIGTIDIPKSGFNVVLQGDPAWLPGFGPMVQAPVNEIAKGRPEVADAVKYILPYGATDQGKGSWEAFLSSSERRLFTKGEGDRQYSRTMTMIAQVEAMKYRQGKRDTPPTAKEIASKTKKFWALQVFTSLVSPASTQYKSPYQFYIDEYHRMLSDPKIGPEKAKQTFLDKHGEDYFVFATSLSKNETGIASSLQADKAARKYKDLIADHPEYGWFFVGPDNKGDFNRNVYTAQQMRKVSPTSSETYRGSYSPQEALAKNNAELGWIEYQNMSAMLEAERIQMGLPSMAVKEAAPLRAKKAAWMAAVADPKGGIQWGQDWLADYEARDSGTVRKFLTAAKAATDDPSLAKRPDVQVMNDYIQAREVIRQVLQKRKAAGGAGSITANQNADIAQVWGKVTSYLVDKNLTFADTYARVLDNDDLTAGV